MKALAISPTVWRAVALLLAVVAAMAVLLLVPAVVYPPLSNAQLNQVTDPQRRIELQQAQAGLQNDVRTTILQALAGLVVIGGAIATWRQVQVNRDSNITQQLGRAVDQLGDANLDRRVGGIYALERIARASAHDQVSIMFMLGAYIRHRAPWPPDGATHPSPNVDLCLPWLRVRQPDVQAAMNVLSRRLGDPYRARLYLARTDLRSVQVNDDAQFTNANFNHANLARAWLRGAILDHSGLRDCDLRAANLAHASLVGADLRHSLLREANLHATDLRQADLRGADLTDADLADANLSNALTDDTTIWPTQSRTPTA